MQQDIQALLLESNNRVQDLVGETPELGVVLKFVDNMLKAFHAFRDKEGRPLSASDLRWEINQRICDLVGAITEADCVFPRQLQTDGSVRLLKSHKGDCLVNWCGDNERVGRPPEEKGKFEGVSGQIINSGSTDPVVIADVLTDQRFSAAHRMSLERHHPDSDEGRFVHKIHSEACIPIQVEGRILGGIVAVRWNPYSEHEREKIDRALRRWQIPLSSLYFLGLQLERRQGLTERLGEAAEAVREVGESMADEDFLRKMVTVLTCDAGLRWHRSLVFLFEDSYPSNARCVIGIGGTGLIAWFEKQVRVQGWKLARYLMEVESAEFASDDPLYRLTTEEGEIPNISKEQFKNNKLFHRYLMGEADGPEHRLSPLFTLSADLPWLKELPWYEKVFQGAASQGDCYVTQLTVPSTGLPFGFVLLDNPYPHSVEYEHDQFLTRMICDLFAAQLAERKLANVLYDVQSAERRLAKTLR